MHMAKTGSPQSSQHKMWFFEISSKKNQFEFSRVIFTSQWKPNNDHCFAAQPRTWNKNSQQHPQVWVEKNCHINAYFRQPCKDDIDVSRNVFCIHICRVNPNGSFDSWLPQIAIYFAGKLLTQLLSGNEIYFRVCLLPIKVTQERKVNLNFNLCLNRKIHQALQWALFTSLPLKKARSSIAPVV